MNALYIYELAIQSSFADDVEEEATEDSFDTVQWWLSADDCWRIRTFDMDSDIHVHSISNALTLEEIDAHMMRKYSDVLFGRYDFPEIDNTGNDIVVAKMKSGCLEVGKNGRFAFWNHAHRKYVSKTKPGDG